MKLREAWTVPVVPPEAPQKPPEPVVVSPVRAVVPTVSPAAVKEPIRACKEAIWAWGAMRGVTGKFDLERVNAKAHALGHPGFVVG